MHVFHSRRIDCIKIVKSFPIEGRTTGSDLSKLIKIFSKYISFWKYFNQNDYICPKNTHHMGPERLNWGIDSSWQAVKDQAVQYPEKRFLHPQLKYLLANTRQMAGIMGLRGTGKTIMLRQLAVELDKSFYISGDTLPVGTDLLNSPPRFSAHLGSGISWLMKSIQWRTGRDNSRRSMISWIWRFFLLPHHPLNCRKANSTFQEDWPYFHYHFFLSVSIWYSARKLMYRWLRWKRS